MIHRIWVLALCLVVAAVTERATATDLHADVRADLHFGIGAGLVTGRLVPADQPGLSRWPRA